jgi:endo-1,4-beta-D-glucanase Y
MAVSSEQVQHKGSMRRFLARLAFPIVALLLLSGAVRAENALPPADWIKYRDHFITADGRVLDTSNHVVSHSEGQGWAMLFAESANDRVAFNRLWRWTREHLQHHDDALFSWQWNPLDDKNPIADANDAADGDILIAWALERAGQRWANRDYQRQAARIVVDIRHRLVETIAGRLVLLPGAQGFKGEDGMTIVNPSYYVFPALRDFSRIDKSRDWPRLRRDGLALIDKARFGKWGVPSDWVDIHGDGEVVPDTHRPPRFGFDAIRVPLYLVWAGEATPERVAGMIALWNGFSDKPIAAWTDVQDNNVAPYPASIGFQAVIELVRGLSAANPPPLPALSDGDDYYSASLTLLAGMARRAPVR